ncbi:MAG: UBA/THIF-type binding protein [Clostridia bacterium]|jgi:molybdopterin/thiamine biosynthesis adenylyltransferase|nr:UBA/THIF-type binding protein [Clostridia bacterium]
MQPKQQDLRDDISQLIQEGYEVEVRGALVLVHHIPYVNGNKEIKYGTLVATIIITTRYAEGVDIHVIDFMGEQPCHADGTVITSIQYVSNEKDLGNGVVVQRSFSNQPAGGYKDYYEMITTYAGIIIQQAKLIDEDVTAQTFQTYHSEEVDSMFVYDDSNSFRARIGGISERLRNLKIGIIGLGGTGGYVLDYIAKTMVSEIHLFDGDVFYQHNAFRAPGAADKDVFCQEISKVEYFYSIYKNMHKGIVTHKGYLREGNMQELDNLDFVFLCVDKGQVRKEITEYICKLNIPVIDCGIGINAVDNQLLGQTRTTLLNPQNNYVSIGKIPLSEREEKDHAYESNIQIAELNSLNAVLAVIQWKKYYGLYQDVSGYDNMVYSINDGELFNE